MLRRAIAVDEIGIVAHICAAHVDGHIVLVGGAREHEHQRRHKQHRHQHDGHGGEHVHREHRVRRAEQRAHDGVHHAGGDQREQQTQPQRGRRVDKHREILVAVGLVAHFLFGVVQRDQLAEPFGPVQHGGGAAVGQKDDQQVVVGIDKRFERHPLGDQHAERR